MMSLTQNVIPFPEPAPEAPVPGSTLTPTQTVEKLLAIRAKMDEIKRNQKEFLKKYEEAETFLENRLMAVLNTTGVRSMRTEAGTFYTDKKTSARVHRWSETLEWIKEHEAWELLEARVNKTALEAILAQTEDTVPGVAVESVFTLHVRKPRAGSAGEE